MTPAQAKSLNELVAKAVDAWSRGETNAFVGGDWKITVEASGVFIRLDDKRPADLKPE